MKTITHLISLAAFAALLSLSCETKMEYSDEANLVEKSDQTSLVKKNKKKKTKTIYGIVDEDGDIVAGNGFTVDLIADPNGFDFKFKITFDQPFGAQPAIAVTLITIANSTQGWITRDDFSPTHFTYRLRASTYNNGTISDQDGFSFIAIGPK